MLGLFFFSAERDRETDIYIEADCPWTQEAGQGQKYGAKDPKAVDTFHSNAGTVKL